MAQIAPTRQPSLRLDGHRRRCTQLAITVRRDGEVQGRALGMKIDHGGGGDDARRGGAESTQPMCTGVGGTPIHTTRSFREEDALSTNTGV
jgi:hypothetical protein